MLGVQGKTGNRRLGLSYIVLVVFILTYLGALAYSSYAAEWRAKADVPQIDSVLKIIKGLRQYQKVNATFPQSFNQVEAQVWKHAIPPDYGAGSRSLVLHNYYYSYTLISPARCTLWMIPVGSHTEESSSYFLVLTPDDREKYKGPPLSLKEASTITGTPTYAQLAMLGMIKQDPLRQRKG